MVKDGVRRGRGWGVRDMLSSALWGIGLFDRFALRGRYGGGRARGDKCFEGGSKGFFGCRPARGRGCAALGAAVGGGAEVVAADRAQAAGEAALGGGAV